MDRTEICVSLKKIGWQELSVEDDLRLIFTDTKNQIFIISEPLFFCLILNIK